MQNAILIVYEWHEAPHAEPANTQSDAMGKRLLCRDNKTARF